MNFNVAAAIFRRNFVSYFSNPTGYVFICVFVLLGSFAAFWPDEFFNANLANLDQLNKWFPYIMLVFIPAITMGVWAEERRQGTDELLLTLPAADIDVVVGKYAAVVAIYSVSLAFSLVCNFSILWRLGEPDFGLFFGTYFGYWLVGLAMLGTGMVASFLTPNLTVAFILGVAFNAPLVFLNVIDTVVRGSSWTAAAKGWSLGDQMSDFGRGVISLSAIIYFVSIALVMLYLCMVLIGRRHWMGGRDGKSVGPHYLVRGLCLAVVAVGATWAVQNFNLRADVTQEQLNSLAPETKTLISKIDPKLPIKIEVYASSDVPQEFVQTRIDLLNKVRDFAKLSGGKIETVIHDNMEPLTEQAQRAEEQFGITPVDVFSEVRGVIQEKKIFLGAAITSGVEKIVIPFFERGIPVEYELVRSISTISQQQRKRVGVVKTDVELFGGFDFASGAPRSRPKEKLIEELEKQYEVVQVDASNPIEKFDALLVVQPSSLPQPQLNNVIEAIRSGQPTAIFEDPMPVAIQAPGTNEPRRPPQQGMMMFQQPQVEPKGDIKQLWKLLGVDLEQKTRRNPIGGLDRDVAIIWQEFKPSRFIGFDVVNPQWIFIQSDAPPAGDFDPFNQESPITSGLQSLVILYGGAIQKLNTAGTDFKPLAKTGTATGSMMVKDAKAARTLGDLRAMQGLPTNVMYIVAAHITGTPQTDDVFASLEDKSKKDEPSDGKSEEGKNEDEKKEEGKDEKQGKSEDKDEKAADKKGINVVLVADIDMLSSAVFEQRAERGPDNPYRIEQDNVAFILNAVDVLAGDDRFVELRKRREKHRALSRINEETAYARQQADAARLEYDQSIKAEKEKFEAEFNEAQQAFNEQVNALQNDENANPREAQLKLYSIEAKLQNQKRLRDLNIQRLEDEAKLKENAIRIKHRNEITRVQDNYKLISVLIPPILPLLVAFFVYFHRRTKEREGVSKARLR